MSEAGDEPDATARPSASREAGPASWSERALLVLDRWLVVAAVAVLAVASLRLVPFQAPFPFSAFEAEARWAALAAIVGLAITLRRHSPRTRIAFGVAAAILVPWSLEWLPVAAGHEGGRAVHLRLLSTNLLAPSPSVPLAREILATDADVVVLQEASDEWWALLEVEGVLARYPHHVEETHSFREDYMGIAILSRRPIVRSGVERLGGTDVPYAWADLATEHGTVRVYSIHTWPPVGGATLGMNVSQFAHVRWLARRDLADPLLAALVIAGDFNASPMSRQYRLLLAETGLIGAHERVGRGFATTWPNLAVPIPPMRLDHVLVGGDVEVVRVREGEGRGSDHLPVLVELSLAR